MNNAAAPRGSPGCSAALEHGGGGVEACADRTQIESSGAEPLGPAGEQTNVLCDRDFSIALLAKPGLVAVDMRCEPAQSIIDALWLLASARHHDFPSVAVDAGERRVCRTERRILAAFSLDGRLLPGAELLHQRARLALGVAGAGLVAMTAMGVDRTGGTARGARRRSACLSRDCPWKSPDGLSYGLSGAGPPLARNGSANLLPRRGPRLPREPRSPAAAVLRSRSGLTVQADRPVAL